MDRTYNIDCMEGMKEYPDNYFDLAVVDPPYGMNWAAKFESKLLKPLKNNKAYITTGDYKRSSWDKTKPEKEYWKQLFRISKNQIIWGGNNFDLPPTRGIIIWDKNNCMPKYSDGELAWTSFDRPLKICYYSWNGFKQAQYIGRDAPQHGNHSIKEHRIHPTQKPIKLYEWIFKNYAEEGQKILDTHLGSGSSRIAAYNYKMDFTGYEIDKDYFDAAEKRFKNHISQLMIFA